MTGKMQNNVELNMTGHVLIRDVMTHEILLNKLKLI